ncbi:hypothetical protein HQO38_25440 [Rhodococcus fascians]|nr:hypothetical protein [Rhodococcus fascians]MBY4141507.1 hypothetical protein [Rhodococcus fascians]MBY4220262.1 hypothetical protein [Rhodococcus fascians]MBY4224998.1 hypothetical protein [Rhodococcus fascians]MBY4235262.1 hypothetical protein [Rhodococcus fascians]
MKRIGSALAAVVGVCLLSACGSSGGGDGPMATVITDRPQPITAVPTTDRGLPSSSVPSTPSSTTPSSTTPSSTTTTTPSAVAQQANPTQYAGKAPGWYYFTSPSGKFECGIAVQETSIAGCHGSLPDSAPEVTDSASSERVKPNSVQIIAGSPAKFESLGDPKFHRFDGPAAALPYGEELTVAGSGSTNGLRCSVDEQTGVTCTDQVGHGFTVSDDDFDLR